MKNQRLCNVMRYAGLLLLSAMVLSGCKSSTNEIKTIQKAGVLKVAMYKESLSATGETSKEKKLADKIGEALGVEVQTVPVDSVESASTMLTDKEADIAIGGISSSVNRDKQLTVSDGYESESWYVVTARGDYSDCLAAFTGRTLGVSSSLSDDALSWMVGNDTIDLGKVQFADALTYLTSENIAGFVCHRDEARRLVDLSADIQVQPMQNALPEEMVILLRSDDNSFLRGINTIISQSQEEQLAVTE